MFNSNNGYSLADLATATRGNDEFGGAWWIIILFLFCFNGGWGNGVNGSGTSELLTAMDASSIKSGMADGFYALNNSVMSGFANSNAVTQGGFADVQNALCSGFGTVNSNLSNGVRDIAAEIAGVSYNNLQNTYTLATQMNQMSAADQMNACQTNQLIAANHADLTYKLASEACENRRTTADGARDIIDNNNANTRAILDFLTQSKIDELSAENAALRSTVSQAEQNAYLVSQLGTKAPIAAYTVANPYASYTSCSSCNGYSY